MNPYPEHAKLEALKGANQTVGDFLEWLDEKCFVIAHYHNGSQLAPTSKGRNKLIAEFFEINENRLEDEKREMLADLVRKTTRTSTKAPRP